MEHCHFGVYSFAFNYGRKGVYGRPFLTPSGNEVASDFQSCLAFEFLDCFSSEMSFSFGSKTLLLDFQLQGPVDGSVD